MKRYWKFITFYQHKPNSSMQTVPVFRQSEKKSMFGVNFGKNAKIQKNRKEFRKQHSE